MIAQGLCILLTAVYLKEVHNMASPRERLERMHMFEVCRATSKCAARADLLQA
jgi:hypothetical protein